MTASGEASTVQIYRRLISFTKPYSGRLVIGVLAGVMAGGSLFGLLRVSPNIIRPFEEPVPAVREEATLPGAGSVEAGVDGQDVGTGDEAVDSLVTTAARYNIPVRREDGRMTWQLMVLGLIALPLFAAIRALGNYLNQYCMRWVGARVVRDLRDELFCQLQSQSLKFFGKSDIGQLISRCTNDTSVVENMLSTTVSDLTRAPVEICVAVVFILMFAVSNGLLGLVAVMGLAFPLCIVPIIVLGRIVRRYTKRSLMGISTLVSRMHENFTGITVVKAFHMEATEAGRFRDMNAGYFRTVMRALRAELLMSPMMEGVAIVLVCVFFVVCYMNEVKLHQIIPLGMAAVVAYRPTKRLASINAGLQRGAAALERIFEVLDSDDILQESSNPIRVREFNDRILFDHVNFSYNSSDGPQVLSDVDIDIPVGSVVALVGETGSGKTTLANLLARFYDPTGGRILLDGHDLRDMEIASLRRLIGVVTQQTILFNDTIAVNIAYGTENATPEAIQNAARRANAESFITSDPAGYNRVVGEKGFVLSGGEKQRIAIARAILKNPPILILDEATSALDTVTESLIQEAISHVMEGRTVFAIAHRLSTVRHADQILLLDRGRIAERGTHDELYNAGGHYRKLCDMQMMDV